MNKYPQPPKPPTSYSITRWKDGKTEEVEDLGLCNIEEAYNKAQKLQDENIDYIYLVVDNNTKERHLP
jgi:hypothetical protein